MNVALWDLDNCLADDGWRIPFVDWTKSDPNKRYDPYHIRCGNDEPGNWSMFAAVSKMAQPIFTTARPESVRFTTKLWIGRKLHCPVDFSTLLMRPSDSHLPSAQLKRAMAERVLAHGHNVVAAFDDRLDVVEMYRSLGIPAAQLWIHNVCAMTPPNERK
jgi:hypothetical protein